MACFAESERDGVPSEAANEGENHAHEHQQSSSLRDATQNPQWSPSQT